MTKPFCITLFWTTLLLGCASPASPRPTTPQPGTDTSGNQKPGDQQQGTSADNTSAGQDPKPGQSSTTSQGGAKVQTDIIVVNAIGGENPGEASRQQASLKSFLSGLAKKYQGQDVRFALIGSPTAAVSSVGIAFDPADGYTATNSQQLSFELAPKDVFLGTLVSACASEASNLDSSHAAGSIKVCSESIAIPPHAWTWGVEDLKGRLVGFLRPGANRIYVLFASSDAVVVSGQEFVTIATKLNSQKKPRVFAIAPLELNGICTSQNQRAAKIDDAVRLSSGKSYSYCQSDWSAFASDLLRSL